jgi:flagellar protein FlgJ
MNMDAVSGVESALQKNAYEKVQSTSEAAKSADDKKLREACKGFEAMFLNFMYAKMRETVPENTLLGRSNGEKIMQSMLDSEMTQQMADAGGIGLADLLYNQLSLENKNRIDYQAHLEELQNNGNDK